MICGKRFARTVPRLRHSSPPAPCRPIAPAFSCSGTPLHRHAAVQTPRSSAAPASRCSGARALRRSIAPALWCSAAPAPHRSRVSLLRHPAARMPCCFSTAVFHHSGALPLGLFTAPALCHSAPAPRCSGGALLRTRGAGAKGWRTESTHRHRVAPPRSNTQRGHPRRHARHRTSRLLAPHRQWTCSVR